MTGALEGIEWTLVGGIGQTLLLDGGHASGSGGCNRFAGGNVLDDDRLSFQPLASTRMACAPSVLRAESDYLAALGVTAQASPADGQLTLAAAAGTELLHFARPPAIEPEEPSWS